MESSPIPSEILQILAESSWLDRKSIAKRIDRHPNSIFRHLKKLEKDKQIKYREIPNNGKAAKHVYALVSVPESTAPPSLPDTQKAILSELQLQAWQTSLEIAQKIGLSRRDVYIDLQRLEQAKKVKHRQGHKGRNIVYYYALVSVPDSTAPSSLPDSQKAILSELKLQAWQTCAEIAQKTGLSKSSVYNSLQTLGQVGKVRHRKERKDQITRYYYALDDDVSNLPKKPSSTKVRPTKKDKITILRALEQRPFQTAEQLAEQFNWSLERTEGQLHILREHDLVEIELAEKTVYCTCNQRSLFRLLYRARTWIPVESVGIALPVLQHWAQSEVGYVVLTNNEDTNYVQITPKGIAHALHVEKKMEPAMVSFVRMCLS